MVSSIVKGGLLGGIVIFVWNMISWMAIPWHEPTWNKFKDPTVAAHWIKENISQDGIYLLTGPGEDSGLTEQERFAAGPIVFASIRAGGMTGMTREMVLSLAFDVIAAALGTWLLMQTSLREYGRRVAFFTTFALAAGVAVHLPNLIWWGFPPPFTLVSIADLCIGWTLAGAAIACVVRRKVPTDAA